MHFTAKSVMLVRMQHLLAAVDVAWVAPFVAMTALGFGVITTEVRSRFR